MPKILLVRQPYTQGFDQAQCSESKGLFPPSPPARSPFVPPSQCLNEGMHKRSRKQTTRTVTWFHAMPLIDTLMSHMGHKLKISMYVCVYIYIAIHIHTYTYIYTHMYIYIYDVCVCVCWCLFALICLSILMYLFKDMCVYIYFYVYSGSYIDI